MENLRDTLEELDLLGFGKHWWKDFLDWSQLKSMPRLKSMVCNKWLIMQLPHIEISENKGWYHNLTYGTHLSTAVAWREKICKHFVFYKYFSLVLGLLKSRISEKIN